MIEVYKYLHGLSPELMTGIFTLRKNPHNICDIRLFGSENQWSVRFGLDTKVFCARQLWQKVPIPIKDSWSLEIFKAEIKLWSCDDCPCNLCKRVIASGEYIQFLWLYFNFFFNLVDVY